MTSFDFTVDAVLFDIDGTLADSTGSVERSWTRLAEAHGVDVDELLAVTHGRRARDTLEEFFPADQVDAAAGVGAGRNAGATVLAVGTSHDPARLTEADHVVADLSGVTMDDGRDGIRVRG